MIAKSFVHAAACAAALVSANAASAAVLVDMFPGAAAAGQATAPARSTGQSVVMQINLTENVKLTGFSVVTSTGFASVGQSVLFRVREDAADAPAATNLHSIAGALNSVTPLVWPGSAGYEVATLNFDPIELAAGTYWIGLSGVGSSLWQATFNLGAPIAPQYYLYGEATTGRFTGPMTSSSLSYQLLGDVVPAAAAVPEPATWAMMIGGLALVGASMRRRATKVAFA